MADTPTKPPPLKLEEFSPAAQQQLKEMPATIRDAVLGNDVKLMDFIRGADFMLRLALQTYGPARALIACSDKITEAALWLSTFDPEQDAAAMHAAAEQAGMAPGGIVLGSTEEAEALAAQQQALKGGGKKKK